MAAGAPGARGGDPGPQRRSLRLDTRPWNPPPRLQGRATGSRGATGGAPGGPGVLRGVLGGFLWPRVLCRAVGVNPRRAFGWEALELSARGRVSGPGAVLAPRLSGKLLLFPGGPFSCLERALGGVPPELLVCCGNGCDGGGCYLSSVPHFVNCFFILFLMFFSSLCSVLYLQLMATFYSHCSFWPLSCFKKLSLGLRCCTGLWFYKGLDNVSFRSPRKGACLSEENPTCANTLSIGKALAS